MVPTNFKSTSNTLAKKLSSILTTVTKNWLLKLLMLPKTIDQFSKDHTTPCLTHTPITRMVMNKDTATIMETMVAMEDSWVWKEITICSVLHLVLKLCSETLAVISTNLQLAEEPTNKKVASRHTKTLMRPTVCGMMKSTTSHTIKPLITSHLTKMCSTCHITTHNSKAVATRTYLIIGKESPMEETFNKGHPMPRTNLPQTIHSHALWTG